mmetsp:Transcript_5911/g.9836  ORF Transcript_5911/g.9836 Transcript_5911/m.9836 type:complete len:439 (+) Transcript_5911:44-1360(+)|eukprot:CAMPEP_0119015716 /NCGR_PEP_ID=MMETSP1176-20130426/11477_1 /TAXON_ID=265551 /ORGANISM="Synedropsis recta cf, Strain CCMP1620" /LENGTH=438 /DNA_ID=CAMNT_0006969029 /DNA_START=36 /DNA_END=1352 /DNA_ORIENTATION=+
MPSSSVSTQTAGLVAVGAFAVGSIVTMAIVSSTKKNNKKNTSNKQQQQPQQKKQPQQQQKKYLFPATVGTKQPQPSINYPTYDYEKDPKGSFLKVCDMLIADIVTELPVAYDLPERETKWIGDMLDYNVKGGKMNRGLMVVDAGVLMMPNNVDDNTTLCQLAVLGWAIEWLQAWLLVADDIMDSSVTRRGQACWYKKLDNLWYIAINDAVTIETLVYKMIKRHFGSTNHERYIQLLDLMMETTMQTELGQLSDTLCDVLDLNDLTPQRWDLIVTYKTSFYSFYLSVAFAMTVAGINDQKAYDAAREILVTMGVYFQAQDDYLDCFGTPEQIGKIGTDIADKKCGWLFTKAYHQLANAEQKAFLDQHYGKCKVGSKEELQIKQIYADLGLPKLYADYEQSSYEKIMAMKDSETGAILEQAGVPWQVFEKFLQKVYKRSK